MNWSTLAGTILTLAAGALIGLVPSLLIERRKEKRQLATRWDAPLYDLSVEFASTVRVFRHSASRLADAPDRAAHQERTEEERQRLNALLEQIRLVGDERVQRAARMVVRHSWAVARVAEGHEDERAAEYPGASPERRLTDALHEFIRAVRVQLRVPHAERIASDEPDDWPELAGGQRPFRIGLPSR
ncbi:hypothetical protein [Micromonospora halophytica]|uniref:Secreted protein n=1 Tax=Micromonospora halophytica TaxID=47864 RepID=A0A1C5IYT3_9ACTN|nr:hypothetical protein [Micromonospora halophytica]SCG63517.1 hypothetical protein GA0070560_118103 [Micromonospora halophytica]